MYLSYLTSLGFFVNGAIETGKYDHITIEEVKTQIRDYNLFEYLEKKLSDDIDVSLWSEEEKHEINQEWENLLCINESKKFCVEKKGLALIMAYILESIQRRYRK